MKSQKVETKPTLKTKSYIKRKKSSKLRKKITAWFRDFLENSE
jgi:hypothetical protein